MFNFIKKSAKESFGKHYAIDLLLIGCLLVLLLGVMLFKIIQ